MTGEPLPGPLRWLDAQLKDMSRTEFRAVMLLNMVLGLMIGVYAPVWILILVLGALVALLIALLSYIRRKEIKMPW